VSEAENPLSETHYSEAEVCRILGVALSRLKARRSCGTEHPPYVKLGRAYYYPKALFLDWASKRPIIWEVKRVG